MTDTPPQIIGDEYQPNCECYHACGAEFVCWEPCINEDGWYCSGCRTKVGRSRSLDRVALREKCHDLLLRLHDHDFLYVSNSDHGEGMVWLAMTACVEAQRFDQQFIIHALFEAYDWKAHSDHFADDATEATA